MHFCLLPCIFSLLQRIKWCIFFFLFYFHFCGFLLVFFSFGRARDGVWVVILPLLNFVFFPFKQTSWNTRNVIYLLISSSCAINLYRCWCCLAETCFQLIRAILQSPLNFQLQSCESEKIVFRLDYGNTNFWKKGSKKNISSILKENSTKNKME